MSARRDGEREGKLDRKEANRKGEWPHEMALLEGDFFGLGAIAQLWRGLNMNLATGTWD